MNDGQLYSNYNQSQRLDAQLILDEFSSEFEWRNDGFDSLLDVGCGPGDVLVDLILPRLPEKSKVIGVDISMKMIECAKKYECNSIKFHRLDIAAEFEVCRKILKAEVELFDNITSFYCQHWIQDQRQALSNMRDLLKPGGKILMVFVVTCPAYDIYESLASFSSYKSLIADWKQFVSPYHKLPNDNPVDLFKSHVAAVNLKVRQIELRHKTFFYDNVDQLKLAVQSVNPFIDRMPPNIYNQFMNDFMKLAAPLVDYNPEKPNAQVVSRYQLIIAVLTK